MSVRVWWLQSYLHLFNMATVVSVILWWPQLCFCVRRPHIFVCLMAHGTKHSNVCLMATSSAPTNNHIICMCVSDGHICVCPMATVMSVCVWWLQSCLYVSDSHIICVCVYVCVCVCVCMSVCVCVCVCVWWHKHMCACLMAIVMYVCVSWLQHVSVCLIATSCVCVFLMAINI